jgi:hypothetical protein
VVPRTPNARPRSAPRNICWTRPETCGLISPPNSPWTTRAAIRIGRSGRARQEGRGREAGDPHLEHHPAAVVVAELAAEHGHQARTPACSPTRSTGARPAGAGVAGDGRQRDVRDAHVEQGHEHRAAADDQRDPPASAVVGGHRSILSEHVGRPRWVRRPVGWGCEPRQIGSTSSAVPSPATRVSTIVTASSPRSPSRWRSCSGATSTPRFLMVRVRRCARAARRAAASRGRGAPR